MSFCILNVKAVLMMMRLTLQLNLILNLVMGIQLTKNSTTSALVHFVSKQWELKGVIMLFFHFFYNPLKRASFITPVFKILWSWKLKLAVDVFFQKYVTVQSRFSQQSTPSRFLIVKRNFICLEAYVVNIDGDITVLFSTKWS